MLAFEARISHEVIKINTDNTTAMSYINKYAGCHSPSLNNLSKEIWFWCIERNIHITAAHVPGVEKISADTLSSKFVDNIEWSLDQYVFTSLCCTFGQPTVDLFASRLNNKLPLFFSWRPDPYSEATNAFTQPWSNLYGYAFPPFNMISRVLNKISRENALLYLFALSGQVNRGFLTLLKCFSISQSNFPLFHPCLVVRVNQTLPIHYCNR